MYYLCRAFDEWSDARVAEEARLESVYTSKAYPEFESRSLRQKGRQLSSFFIFAINTIETNSSRWPALLGRQGGDMFSQVVELQALVAGDFLFLAVIGPRGDEE